MPSSTTSPFNRPIVKSIALFSILAFLGLSSVSIWEIQQWAKEKPPKENHQWIIPADLHTHSYVASSLASPLEICHLARRKGLFAVAITDHNTTIGGKLAQSLCSLFYPNLVVLVGEELTRYRHHIVILGLRHTLSADLSLEEIVEVIATKRLAWILAHPVRRFWRNYDRLIAIARQKNAPLPGLEALTPAMLFEIKKQAHPIDHVGALNRFMHALYRSPNRKGMRFRAEDGWIYAQKHRDLPWIGSSDYHGFGYLGVAYTVIFARRPAPKAILRAIQRGDTVPASDTLSIPKDPHKLSQPIAPHKHAPYPIAIILSLCFLFLQIALAFFLFTDRQKEINKN